MEGTEKDEQLVKLLGGERLQTLQDNLAKALDLAFATVDYRGRPVIRYSGFTDYCTCMRSHEKYRHLCFQCDAHGGLHATITGKPYIYRCHGGLVDFAVPLIVDGKYVGSVMGGQAELVGEAPRLEPILPQRTPWEEEPDLKEVRDRVHKTTYEKLEASVCLVRDVIQNILEEEYRRVTREELERKRQELMEEKAARVSLELAAEERGGGFFPDCMDHDYLFYVLNVISRLAFRENAEETERTVCDFAAMMRYLLENEDSNFVTVGEELEYIGYYLQIQKRRLEGRMRYEIRVPEKYQSTLCPFMLLHPLVEYSMKYTAENSREGGNLIIQGWEDSGMLVLSIRDNRTGMSGHQNGRKPPLLTRIDHSLRNVFGSASGVTVRAREDGMTGTEIQIRLPLSSGALGR